MKEITELENPNSVVQMKQWLAEKGLETDTLGKKKVAELMKTARTAPADGPGGSSSFKTCPRTTCRISLRRALVRSGDFSALEMLYGSVPEMLSELIRTAFVPKPGCKFVVADFSAIEARVIAWLAGEHWRQEVFANGGDIYCASASQMFKIPVEKNGVNGHLRQKGKIAELALGYGGSVGALKAMGALEMGLTEDELPSLVSAWRASNPHIMRLWWDVDKAAGTTVRERTVSETHGIRFICQSGMLFITLPSGRRLAYVKPRIGTNRFGSDCVTYEGVGATKKWERMESYGPKFVENIMQAVSRDILCDAMRRLDRAGYRIDMHVHDECVIEAPMVRGLGLSKKSFFRRSLYERNAGLYL